MTSDYTLIVLSQSPYVGSGARAALDMALAYAVFGQAPRVLIQGEGVLQLAENQQPVGRNSLRKVIDSLPLYDIEEVFVAASDAQKNSVAEASLPGHANLVSADEAQMLRANARHILSL